MKKYLFVIALVWLLPNFLFATASETVCSKSELASVINERFFNLNLNDAFTAVTLFDTQTIKIDQKNKTIEVWMLEFATKGHSSFVEKRFGMKNHAYYKRLIVIDYSLMRTKLKAYGFYKCNGAVIQSSSEEEPNWVHIPSGSNNESIAQGIMEKYKLK